MIIYQVHVVYYVEGGGEGSRIVFFVFLIVPYRADDPWGPFYSLLYRFLIELASHHGSRTRQMFD